ncbi:mobilization protein [Barnesiella sp. ET7]|uniref:mobilization protein n=1 Tax=Barnesiella sp. ET7 TaxID=2972460 RepID=UPI0021ABB755|nr:mobilization protein [Barnesiella sp. ET7]MCR8912959.1 mobilization protein [Barnesiella sp. ET7]
MNQKNVEYIALYFLVIGVILVIGILVRLFALSQGLDDFSSTIAFFVTVIVLTALYASLQITFDQLLSPRIKAFLLRCPAFQKMKDNPDSVPSTPLVEHLNQVPFKRTDPAAADEGTISASSEYEALRTHAIAEKNRATQTRLKKVLNYTKQTMAAYMSEEDLIRLCKYITEYSSCDTLQKISPVKVDAQLKSIDIMHFGWNIGKAFNKKRVHTATFIKNVFAHTLRDLEISTIERKMSHTESECKIKLNPNIT